MILNLIIPAKTIFPGKVTLTGSRDQDVDISLEVIIILLQWGAYSHLYQRISAWQNLCLEKTRTLYNIINMNLKERILEVGNLIGALVNSSDG